MKISELQPCNVWNIFAQICAVPHPSGHETALRERLVQIASDAGLTVRTDAAGNLRIDRAPSPGMETKPAVLMQCHMDMVPQNDAAHPTDFTVTPVLPRIDGDFVTATGTTLGADNGMGVAAALALLLDPDFHSGPLALLATVEEETTMRGALEVAPEFLNADYLLNLDSEEEGEFYLGCAGGAKLVFDMPLRRVPTPPGFRGWKITISGMKGGHSGMEIDHKRGNALMQMLTILIQEEDFHPVAIDGGSVENAIPRECTAILALPPRLEPLLRQYVQATEQELKAHYDVAANCRIELAPVETPPRVWATQRGQDILGTLVTTPDGVLAHHNKLKVVETSNNLASIHTGADALRVTMMCRSLSAPTQKQLVHEIKNLYKTFGNQFVSCNEYIGWEPNLKSKLAATAQKCYQNMFGQKPELKVIHAGLECGTFANRNPHLDMLSFGPTVLSPHSPSERVEIASVGKFYRFLSQLLSEL